MRLWRTVGMCNRCQFTILTLVILVSSGVRFGANSEASQSGFHQAGSRLCSRSERRVESDFLLSVFATNGCARFE